MRRWPAVLIGTALAGCSGHLSALDPAGPGAGAIARLTWLFVGVGGVAYVLTMAAFASALVRGMRRGRDSDQRPASPRNERSNTFMVTAGVLATVLALSVLVGASYATDRSLLSMERNATVDVSLTAHQWWWEIRYSDPVASKGFVTANELHLPVGEPVKIALSSTDVIHSLWVPNITGKRDIIPGRDNQIWVTATKLGEWRGRCAEFCGYQHAHMELLVVVERREAFDAWRAAQATPSSPPTTDEERHGQQVFTESACVVCHVIRGSPAGGYSGTAPDLTHLKSRRTIAAGTVPNTKGYLGGWVADPQGLKPGNHMPPNLLAPERFQALLAYLETLR